MGDLLFVAAESLKGGFVETFFEYFVDKLKKRNPNISFDS